MDHLPSTLREQAVHEVRKVHICHGRGALLGAYHQIWEAQNGSSQGPSNLRLGGTNKGNGIAILHCFSKLLLTVYWRLFKASSTINESTQEREDVGYWFENCQRAFDDLKAVVSQEPVFTLPDFSKPFEIHTCIWFRYWRGFDARYASNSIWKPQAEWCRAMLIVQEKEMAVVVFCLRVWRHYLLGAHFTIKTNNMATNYF